MFDVLCSCSLNLSSSNSAICLNCERLFAELTCMHVWFLLLCRS